MATPPPPQPELDWTPERARALGERAVALWEELLTLLPGLPVDRGRPADEVRAAVALDVPDQGLDDDALMGHLRELALERSMYPGHPGFMGYISGAGTVPGAVGELLAGALNQNVGGWLLSPGASEVEAALTRWLAARFGLPEGAGGLIVGGGAFATFIGLKLARDAHGGEDVRELGVREPLAVYASTEAHVVADRAADQLGLGSRAVRRVATDAAGRLDPVALDAAIARDRAAGMRPIAVVATAGTTATGAIDPLPALAERCERDALWLHVDAAYGGPAVLADDLRPLLAGIDRADSIAVDPHKWLYTPVASGCVLVRDLRALAESFAVRASYVQQDLEATGRGVSYADLGPGFSRGFDALKVWLSLLAHGSEAYGRRISHDAALARYMGELATERPDFELAAPVGLSICCFRYVPPGWASDDPRLDDLTERLFTAIQLDGRAYCSNAVIDGRQALRACIVNFRTEAPDVERLLDVAAELGARLAADRAA